MSDARSGPDTDEFPAIQEGMEAPVGVHGSEITVAPVRRNTRSTGITMGILVVLLLVIVGAAAYVVSGLGSDDPAPQTVVVTETPIVEVTPEQAPEPAAEPTPEPAEPTDVPAGRPTAPTLPAGHSPVNDAATQNLPGGDLNNVYTGTSTTSPGFALNVRDAFVRYYLDTGELNGQVRATSPATGMTYDVDCVDNGEFVTCTAGDNAVIYIS